MPLTSLSAAYRRQPRQRTAPDIATALALVLLEGVICLWLALGAAMDEWAQAQDGSTPGSGSADHTVDVWMLWLGIAVLVTAAIAVARKAPWTVGVQSVAGLLLLLSAVSPSPDQAPPAPVPTPAPYYSPCYSGSGTCS